MNQVEITAKIAKTNTVNFDNPGMCQAMIDAMKFWVEEIGIDGFRCDAADYVPFEFWKDCVAQLRATGHPLLMLAGFPCAGILTEERFTGLIGRCRDHGSSLASGNDLNIKVRTWYLYHLNLFE